MCCDVKKCGTVFVNTCVCVCENNCFEVSLFRYLFTTQPAKQGTFMHAVSGTRKIEYYKLLICWQVDDVPYKQCCFT